MNLDAEVGGEDLVVNPEMFPTIWLTDAPVEAGSGKQYSRFCHAQLVSSGFDDTFYIRNHRDLPLLEATSLTELWKQEIG